MKSIHLIISSIVVVPIALVYGTGSDTLFPILFDFKADTTDLHNIFRAIMCLYIGMVIIWVVGIFKARFWEVATISNIVFMGSLAIGRLISFMIDGIGSPILIIGFCVEILLAITSYYNWRKYAPK
ncbi:hypothetical protein BH10BAC2_BH10BAC2_32940 [soil metagenome]